MNKFFISTDLTSDFPDSLKEDDFGIINMSYFMDNVLYDGVNTPYLSPKKFFEKLRGGSLSQTSMVTSDQVIAFFRPALEKGMDVLHLSFASVLSGNYNSCIAAQKKLAQEFPKRKIIIMDTFSAGMGLGLLSYYTLRARAQGKSIDECAKYADELKNNIVHLFTVDDMFHLYRGGRVSKGAAILGSVIQLKPVLYQDIDGYLKVLSKTIGKKPALRYMLDKMIQKIKGYDNEVVFIGHGDAYDEAAWLAKKITEKTGITNIVLNNVGPVIGTHVGAGLISLFFVGCDRS
ncbi:MAG TPA: DegV family protein [Clostridia bacterium]|nr:DegV family protein [Clostridia bacterium]